MSSLPSGPIAGAFKATATSKLRNVCLSCRLGLGLLRLSQARRSNLRTFSTIVARRSEHLDPNSPDFDPLPPGLMKDPLILQTPLRPKRWLLKQQIEDAKSLPISPFPGALGAHQNLSYELLFGPININPNSPAELKTEIEKIRPHSKLVTIERREQLVELLNQKFNKGQLFDYWSTRFMEKEGALKATVSARRSFVKAKVIDSILDEIWEVTAVASKEGAEDVLVRKTLKVDRRDLFFLIRQDGKILRFWAVSSSAKFQVNLGDLSIVVVATEKQIEHIENWLAKVRAQINSRTITMDWHKQLGQMPDQRVLAELSRLTNTFIELVDERNIQVSNLGKKEGPFQDVKRLLYLYYDQWFKQHYTALVSHPTLPVIRLPVAEQESMPWRYRNHDWIRYSQPLTLSHLQSTQPSLPPPSPAFTSAITSQLLDLTSSGPSTNHTLRATYTYILHDALHPPLESLDTLLVAPLTAAPASLSAIPNITNIVRDLTLLTQPFAYPQPSIDEPLSKPPQHPSNSSVLLRFTACPWTHKNFKSFPRLEVTLQISEDGKVHSPETKFIVDRKVVDVYRPDCKTDVRFEKVVDIQGSVVSAELPQEVERYLDESNIDFGDGGRIKPGSELRVWVPKTLVSKEPVTEVIEEAGGEKHVEVEEMEHDDGTEVKDVRYLFSEMEVRQSVEFEYEVPRSKAEIAEGEEDAEVEKRTLRVIRRDIEGGISGGRRVELVAEPMDMAKATEPAEVAAFVEGILQLGAKF